MAPLLLCRHSEFFNALVVSPNASHFRWALLHISGFPRPTPPYLVYESFIDYHELRNLEAKDG